MSYMERAVQRVALVHQPWSTVPPSPSDPLGISIDRTARHLAERCQVVCYATQHAGQLPAQPMLGLKTGQGEIRRVSAPLDRLLMPMKILDRLGIGGTHRPFNASRFYQLGYVLKVGQSLRADPSDVVHIHQFPQWVPILRKINPALPIVLHMHDDWLGRLDPHRTRQRLRDADLILGVSQHIADSIRRAYPEFDPIVHHAYAGIEDAFFSVERQEDPSGAGRLIFAAPLARDKGVVVLVDAFERVREKIPTARLALIGEETEPGLIDQLRASLSPAVRSAVAFKGELAGPALAEQFAQSDVAIAPTVGQEPSGVHLLRAMAAGLCPVATKVGAFPELIRPGQTGQLVTPNNAGDLAAAIVAMLQDSAARRSMGSAARQFAQDHFRWSVAADSLLQRYAQAAEHRREAARLGRK